MSSKVVNLYLSININEAPNALQGHSASSEAVRWPIASGDNEASIGTNSGYSSQGKDNLARWVRLVEVKKVLNHSVETDFHAKNTKSTMALSCVGQ